MRVATFNILHGRSPSDDRVDLDRFAAAIHSLDADVLALREVDGDQPRSLSADLTQVAANAMGATDHRFVAAMAGTPTTTWRAATGAEQPGTASYGIAVLSRYPVRRWQVLRLPPLRVPMPKWHGRLRPDLVRDEARVAVRATVHTPTGPVLVATTTPVVPVRLERRPAASADARRLRATGARDRDGRPQHGPRLASRATGMQPLATQMTFPAHRPHRQPDDILARELPRKASGEAVRLPLSDHLALVVDVSDTDR